MYSFKDEGREGTISSRKLRRILAGVRTLDPGMLYNCTTAFAKKMQFTAWIAAASLCKSIVHPPFLRSHDDSHLHAAEMELHASADECEDVVQRYGRVRDGAKWMTLEGIADTLHRVRAGTIDAGNAFVRRYLLSLSSDQAVPALPRPMTGYRILSRTAPLLHRRDAAARFGVARLMLRACNDDLVTL